MTTGLCFEQSYCDVQKSYSRDHQIELNTENGQIGLYSSYVLECMEVFIVIANELYTVYIFFQYPWLMLIICGLADFIVVCCYTGEENGPEESRGVTSTECSTGTGESEFTRTSDIVDVTT